jgi:AraC family transcriptional regulator
MPAIRPPIHTVLHIKNMVCDRCIRVVTEEMERLGFSVIHVVLGEAAIEGSPSREQLAGISDVLKKNGFELLENKTAKLIEQIKLAVIEIVGSPSSVRNNFSRHLSKKLAREY